jgi:hypothetical protein
MKKILLSMLVVAGLLVPATSRAVDDACAAEVDKFCGDVIPGQHRVIDCLKAHASQFSPGCKTQLQAQAKAVKAELKKIGKACKNDIDKFCAKVEPGEGRIAMCLADNSASLSKGCVAAIKKH